MLFDSSFISSAASESVLFAVWIAVGATALFIGAGLVVHANRTFRRRVVEREFVTTTSPLVGTRGESVPRAA